MNAEPVAQSPKPKWLTVVEVAGALWYAFGLLQFWLAYSADPGVAVAAGTISTGHASAIISTPQVVWLAFALASAAGLIGTVLLLVRSTKALPMFIASLTSALVYYAWVYVISGSGAERPLDEAIIAAVVILVTLGFALLSRSRLRLSS